MAKAAQTSKTKAKRRSTRARYLAKISTRRVPLRDLSAAEARAAEHDAVQSDARFAPGAAGRVQPSVFAAMVALTRDARALFRASRRAGRALWRTGLLRASLRVASDRIAPLLDARRAWHEQHARTTPAALRHAREVAAQLRTDMIAAGRFVLRQDADAQRELDRIARGHELNDLVCDLRALASLYERHAEELRGPAVPENAARRARELARQLAVAAAEEVRPVATHAKRGGLRGAIARLGDSVQNARAAGRYALRVVPARLALLGQEYLRARRARVQLDQTRKVR